MKYLHMCLTKHRIPLQCKASSVSHCATLMGSLASDGEPTLEKGREEKANTAFTTLALH